MSRRRDERDDEREELLAAHVTGGLDAGEAAEVEALLAERPEARAEADEIARLLAEVRAAEPRPSDEPDWESMARSIQRACDGAADPAAATDRARPRPSRWSDRLRPARSLAARRAVRWPASLVGAAAAAAVILFLTRPSPPTTPSPATAPGTAASARPETAASAGADPTTTPGVAVAVSDDGSDDRGDDDPTEELELDPLAAPADPGGDPAEDTAVADLERALGEERADADSFIADLLADDPFEEGADDRAAALAAPELALDDDPVDPFRADDPSALDRLADELDDQDLEALDRFLAEVHAG